MHNVVGKHKLVGSSFPWNGGGASFKLPYLLEILSTRTGAPAFPVATGSLVANTGQSVTVSRSASAYCSGNDGLLHLLGANTARVEPAGLLVEGASTQLVYQSNTFSNGVWTQQNTTFAQNVTGPDGISNSAWTMTASAATGYHRIYQSIGAGPTQGTRSIYAKAGTVNFVGVYGGGSSNYCTFDLQNGVVSNQAGTTSASIVALANGWYRCIWSSNTNVNYFILNLGVTAANCQGDTAWAAAGTETIQVAFSQLENLAFATSYIPNATAGTVTRDADVVSVSNPLHGLSQPVNTWRASCRVTPPTAWSGLGGYFSMLTCPTTSGATANAWSLYFNAQNVTGFAVYDVTDTVKYVQSGTDARSGSTPVAFLATDASGTQKIYNNGTDITPASAGGGTGVISTQNATLSIGGPDTQSSVSAFPGGWLTDIFVDNT